MRKLVLATIGIWAAGIGSAAALVTTLTRPPAPPPGTELARVAIPHEEPPPDIERFKVPKPLDFVAAAKNRVRAQVRLPLKPAKKQLRCSGFKPLQIGPIDRGVRYCE